MQTCRSRLPLLENRIGCRTERSQNVFSSLSFFLFFPDCRHSRQNYLILVLIAERTKRKWPYPATIAIVVHDLRTAIVIFCRSRIPTYCRSWERSLPSSIPLNHGYHILPRSCPTYVTLEFRTSDRYNNTLLSRNPLFYKYRHINCSYRAKAKIFDMLKKIYFVFYIM